VLGTLFEGVNPQKIPVERGLVLRRLRQVERQRI